MSFLRLLTVTGRVPVTAELILSALGARLSARWSEAQMKTRDQLSGFARVCGSNPGLEQDVRARLVVPNPTALSEPSTAAAAVLLELKCRHGLIR
jgi:hypothetical protein